MIVRTMFKKLGIRVDIAADGLEAIEMAAGVAYDLIYMDVHMPAKDGPEAARLDLPGNEEGCGELLLNDLRLSLLKYGHRARGDRKPMDQAS